MAFPIHRLRRLRRTAAFRDLVRETRLSPRSLIYPLFVCPGSNVKDEIRSMPGNYRWSVDLLVEECKAVYDLGIPAIILFGIPESKDEVGSGAYDADGDVHNDATLELLGKAALTQAQAGADMVAPSDMMDGRVGRIREVLDSHGFGAIPIMAYSAKYASALYGPFREAADSAPAFGDRRSYQMDPANQREAMREIALDIEEGADIIMVKPGLAYLDIIALARREFDLPIAAYQVSGEYSMIEAAARAGWIDRKLAVLETLLSIRRAGADIILTYFAKDAARWLGC